MSKQEKFEIKMVGTAGRRKGATYPQSTWGEVYGNLGVHADAAMPTIEPVRFHITHIPSGVYLNVKKDTPLHFTKSQAVKIAKEINKSGLNLKTRKLPKKVINALVANLNKLIGEK